MDDVLETHLSLQRRFADFLSSSYGEWVPADEIRKLYNSETGVLTRRLEVDITLLRRFDASLLQRLLDRPAEALPAFEDALKEYCKSGQVDEDIAKCLQLDDEMFINLVGEFGPSAVSPRELLSPCLNKLVKVFGIVTKCSLVRPKVVKSVHFCEKTNKYTTKEYRDVTSLTGAPTNTTYPTRDEGGNNLVTEFGLCKYRDHQMITMQELPETAAPGQMPHSIDVMLENDLVDSCKPGDRVAVVGIYKALAPRAAGATSGVFRAVVVGNSVEKFTKDAKKIYTRAESIALRNLAQNRPDFLDLLASSLAPSIYGHDTIKKGLVLQLVGGLEKKLESGGHLRGDINCLLVGDPGVAKSQLLRAVMNVAPHAVSTSGRGSSGVGLTAAVTTDGETGEKRLEAGAMVLADRGTVCIDEFDKMSEVDRVAIHEVMEQQTVTIAKAGIHTSLNARCTVLAAANPLYGTYDTSVPVTRNVNLPDSLLSRFDMLFIVRDNMTAKQDRALALHVLGQHRYRPEGDDGMTAPVMDTIHDWLQQHDDEMAAAHGDGENPNEPQLFVKFDARLHGAHKSNTELLKSVAIKKFLALVRVRYGQVGAGVDIEPAAEEAIIAFFSQLRSKSGDSALPITARTLETIIRLATASCKLRLDFMIREDDVAVARSILEACLRPVSEEHEADELQPTSPDRDEGPSPAKRRRTSQREGRRLSHPPPSDGPDGGAAGDGGEDDDEDGDDDDGGIDPASGAGAGGSSQRTGGRKGAVAGSSAGGSAGPSSSRQKKVVQAKGELTQAQLYQLCQVFLDLQEEFVDEFITMHTLKERLATAGLEIGDDLLMPYLEGCQERSRGKAKGPPRPYILMEDDKSGFMIVAGA